MISNNPGIRACSRYRRRQHSRERASGIPLPVSRTRLPVSAVKHASVSLGSAKSQAAHDDYPTIMDTVDKCRNLETLELARCPYEKISDSSDSPHSKLRHLSLAMCGISHMQLKSLIRRAPLSKLSLLGCEHIAHSGPVNHSSGSLQYWKADFLYRLLPWKYMDN